MKPTQHPTTNTFLQPPPGVSIDECIPLPITRMENEQKESAVRSFWRPNDAERKAIAEGALISFTCWGRTHPPMWIAVDGLEDQA